MKIKRIALMLALIITLLPMSVISAEKNKTKETLTTEQSLQLLKDNSWKSNEQLAKEAKMKLSDFLRVKKFTLNLKDSEINFVKPEEILRSAGCMVCKVGRLINLGNECTSEKPTGNERPCLHSFRYGSDIELARQCQTTVRCDHCGYTSSSRWTDYVWECHGFSR